MFEKRHKIHFITHGCSANSSDSEVMQGLLKEEGYALVATPENADLIVLNTCTVKNTTENIFLREFKKFHQKPLVITGCIAQATPEKFPENSVVGTHQVHRIVDVVEETLQGNVVSLTRREKNPRLNLPKIRRNPIIEMIPINQGCLNFCTFCQTKIARGNLMSYSTDEIITQSQQAIRDGVKEIWLTSQDTGAYGKDMGIQLPDLLSRLIKLDGDFMIRLGMANPNHVIGFLDDLIEIVQHPKVFKFVHIPVQSGNNTILQKMLREYRVEDFQYIVKRFRDAVPEVTIATDVICGFPTETDEQFMDTIRLFRELQPDVLHISRYSNRPKTAAARMPQLSGAVIKDRSRQMAALFNTITVAQNKRWIGWKGSIVIDDYGKNNTLQGRNYAYKPVVIEGNYPLGTALSVEIVSAAKYDLRGTVLNHKE